MGFGNWLKNAFVGERYSDGSIFYTIGQQSHSVDGYTNDLIALKNPVVFGIIDKIAMYMGQVLFYTENENDPLLRLINDPNEYQSKQDFLKEYIFQRISNGFVFVAPIGSEGFENRIDRVDSIYNLTACNITYTADFQTKLLTRDEVRDARHNFYYDINGTQRPFKLDQVIPFFDVCNGVTEDFLLRSPSKLDSVLLPAVNMIKAYEAQNVVLKSNGREMFFSESKSNNLNINKPIGNDDKAEIQRKNRSYGLELNKSRSMFLRGETGWKSLHIDSRELGLKEAIETTASAIAAAFNISKDIIPVFENSKYTNKKESEISFINQVVEPIAADIVNSFNSFFKGYEDGKLKYSIDHLAPMQHIEDLKAEKAFKLSAAFRNYTQSGLTVEQTNELLEQMGIKLIEDDE